MPLKQLAPLTTCIRCSCLYRRMQMKTGYVALVLCLNIGVDPPDVIKISPCARMECWLGECPGMLGSLQEWAYIQITAAGCGALFQSERQQQLHLGRMKWKAAVVGASGLLFQVSSGNRGFAAISCLSPLCCRPILDASSESPGHNWEKPAGAV